MRRYKIRQVNRRVMRGREMGTEKWWRVSRPVSLGYPFYVDCETFAGAWAWIDRHVGTQHDYTKGA